MSSVVGVNTAARVAEIVAAMERYGGSSITVLSGVPGTGKSFMARAAAQQFAGHPLFVKEVQFHQSFTYEDFLEGLRPSRRGGYEIIDGVFTGVNATAARDPDHRYVLLIEEFTRTNITAVLGELMTYLEHRDRTFELALSRRRMKVARNLTVIATMNPRDRSALEVDDALVRRLCVFECPPDTIQLREMLSESLIGSGSGPGEPALIDALAMVFDRCREAHPETYAAMMPFGHGMFAGVTGVNDLRALWEFRIKHMLKRPLVLPHPYTATIEASYPWKGSTVNAHATPAASVDLAGDSAQATSTSVVEGGGSQQPSESGRPDG